MKNEVNANGWSPALEAVIEAATENGKVTNDICKKLAVNEDLAKAGKTVAAIRGKAITMGLYQAGEKSAKPNGEAVTRKADLVSAIETLVSVNKGSLDTLEKASKPQLEALSNALVALSDQAE